MIASYTLDACGVTLNEGSSVKEIFSVCVRVCDSASYYKSMLGC